MKSFTIECSFLFISPTEISVYLKPSYVSVDYKLSKQETCVFPVILVLSHLLLKPLICFAINCRPVISKIDF